MIDDIRRAESGAIDAAKNASSLDALRTIESDALGKKGTLAGFKSRLGLLDAVEERKQMGQVLNEATAAGGGGDRRPSRRPGGRRPRRLSSPASAST